MADPTEEEIRTRAFQLWKDAGEPDGMMEKFWYQAEKELLQGRAARTAVRRELSLKVGDGGNRKAAYRGGA
jgi:Protein of unknown function (DUF2934)